MLYYYEAGGTSVFLPLFRHRADKLLHLVQVQTIAEKLLQGVVRNLAVVPLSAWLNGLFDERLDRGLFFLCQKTRQFLDARAALL